jgi:hypothetical protein
VSPALRLAALVAATSLAAGCAREAGPEASYRALALAVSQRDGDAAWALLSAGSQRWLEGKARRAAAAAPGVVAPSARELLVGDAALGVRLPAAVSVARKDGERVVLRVEPAGGGPAREVLAVREGGRWKVELPLPSAP